MIAIIDYGAGNLFSVKNALDFLGLESVITKDPDDLRSYLMTIGDCVVVVDDEEIIKVHFDHVEENVLKQVLATFYWIRGLYNIQKKPSTSEVIDWIRALELGGVPSWKIKEAVPFAGVLLKKNEDIDTMRKYLK